MKEDEIAMSDKEFKQDLLRHIGQIEHELHIISYASDPDRHGMDHIFKPTPLETCLKNINDTIGNIGGIDSDLGYIQSSIEFAGKRIKASIEHSGNQIEAAIDRHARATTRMAMSATEKTAIDDACVEAIVEARFSDVKALINSGANVHHRAGPDNRTLFSIACATGNKQIIKLLLDNDVTTGDRDGVGKTALDYARAACDKDVLDVLGEHGISVW